MPVEFVAEEEHEGDHIYTSTRRAIRPHQDPVVLATMFPAAMPKATLAAWPRC